MRSSIFGWSYPPGCSGPPDDPGFCEVCGENIDYCECPECPICHEYGNPDCYKFHGMKRTEEQKFSLECAEREWRSRSFDESEYWKELENEIKDIDDEYQIPNDH
jgi:hypothetical protein